MSESPTKRKVLILSVSRKVSLIKAFKDAGWHVTGADNDPNAIALKFCDDVAQPDMEQGPFDMILPTRDAELKMGTHGASNEAIDICLDKVRFSEWCLANGFLAPKTLYTQETRERGVVGSAFVKPRFSSSQNKEAGWVECVFQERVEGEEYSVDLFADFNGKVISVVPRLRLKILNGESVVTKTVENAIITRSSISIAESLGLIGHNCLQAFMLTQTAEPIWTDINLRYGGGSSVSIKAKLSSPEWYLKLINGEEVKPCIGEYQVGLIGRSYSEWDFGSQK